MRKIPAGTQTNNILTAEVDFLDTAISGFIRLTTACSLGHLTEVAVPTKFIFIFMGPHRYKDKYYQVGRAYATLMSDQVWQSSKSLSTILITINHNFWNRFSI